jgi:hypothetical protein
MFPQWLIMLININVNIESPYTWPRFNKATNIVAAYYHNLDIEEMFQCPRQNLKKSRNYQEDVKDAIARERDGVRKGNGSNLNG